MLLFVTYRTVIRFLFLQKSFYGYGREGKSRTMKQNAAFYTTLLIMTSSPYYYRTMVVLFKLLMWALGWEGCWGAGHCQFCALGVKIVGCGTKMEAPRFLLDNASVRPSEILAVFTPLQTAKSGEASRLPTRAEWHFLVLRNNCVLWRPEGTEFVDFVSERRMAKQLDLPQKRSKAANIY